MVRRTLVRATLLVAAVVGLGSCQFFGLALSSTFPAAITQMTARRDLGPLMSASDAYSFSLTDVSVGGKEYVILGSALQTNGIRLIIMDTDLNVLLTLTLQDITALGGSLGTAPPKLSAAWMSIDLAAGNLFFQTNAAGLVLPPLVYGVPVQGPGFSLSVSGNFNFQDFSVAGNGFSYNKYSDTWGVVGTFGAYPILGSPSANFSLHGMFTDPDPARQCTLFVLSDADTGLDHYFVIPMTDLNSGVLAFPLQNWYEVFTKPTTDPNLLGYANGGFIRFVPSGGSRSGAFVRTDLNGVDQPVQLPAYNLPDVQAAYSQSGGFYFLYDRGGRTVTRMAAWWN